MTKKSLPIWFKVLNSGILLPILLFPIVFYSTVFFFDSGNTIQANLLFFGVNAYPLYLILIMYLNSLLFRKSNILGTALAIIMLLLYAYGVSQF